MFIKLHLNTMSLILNTHPIHEFSASCVIQQYPPRRRMISVTYPKPLHASHETLQRCACCRRHGCCRRARCLDIGVDRYSQTELWVSARLKIITAEMFHYFISSATLG